MKLGLRGRSVVIGIGLAGSFPQLIKDLENNQNASASPDSSNLATLKCVELGIYAGGKSHPERHLKTFTGILEADAYGGHNPLFKVDRDPGPLRTPNANKAATHWPESQGRANWRSQFDGHQRVSRVHGLEPQPRPRSARTIGEMQCV